MQMLSPEISVLIASYRRPALLRQTLESLCAIQLERQRWEVIVVDNADDNATRALCDSYLGQLPLRYCCETKPGKNAALNTGITLANGSLLVFSDDDIVADPRWLSALEEAASRWPTHQVFGGSVIPRWPKSPPRYLAESRYLSMCFTLLKRSDGAGPKDDFIPFGPNMAVRKAVFSEGERFDETVGPRQGSYIMGSETDFLRRAITRFGQAVYVPEAKVEHQVREEQLRLRWLWGRGVRYGRQLAFQDAANGSKQSPEGFPRWILRDAISQLGRLVPLLVSGKQSHAFDTWMELAVLRGYWLQHRLSNACSSSKTQT